MTVLSDYETQVADLLHDPNNQLWTISQLDRYINEARRQLVMDTGCLRSLQQSYCSQGQEAYPFGGISGASIISGGSLYTAPTIVFSGGGGSGVAATLTVTDGVVTAITFTSPGSGYSTAPSYVISDATGSGATIALGFINVYTYDVLNINLIWGAYRYPLLWRAWSEFSAKLRGYTTLQQQPLMWAAYGDAAMYLGPLPDQTYSIELDTIILPTPLVGYVTIDPIPPVTQDPIKFYAAYLAKFYDQSYGEAEVFRQQYQTRLIDVQGAYQRRIPSVLQGS